MCLCWLLQLLNELSSQLPQRPVAVAQGSILCFLLHLVPTAVTSNNTSTSLGRLQLHWKRKHPIRLGSSSGGSGSGSSKDPPSGERAAAAVGGVGAAGDMAASPGEVVVTGVPLPAVVVQDSWMRVKLVCPSTVTSGLAFPLALQVRGASRGQQAGKVLLLLVVLGTYMRVSWRCHTLLVYVVPCLLRSTRAI